MRLINLLFAHFFHNRVARFRRIGIAAYGAEPIPKVGPHQIRSQKAQTCLIVPTNRALRARMSFHCGAHVPLKRALEVLLHPEAKRIERADQFLGFGIAGTRGGLKRRIGFIKLPLLHKRTPCVDIRKDRRSQYRQNRQYFAHALFLTLVANASWANDLPAPLTPDQFHRSDPEKASIGQLLFYDKILSGNKNIACGTCHHHDYGSADGVSLGIGEGGFGLGPQRTAGTGKTRIRTRIPRHAPALWNIAHNSIRNLFHDGRIFLDDRHDNGFSTPAKGFLPKGLDNITAAQALFPLTAQFEMAGDPEENPIARAAAARSDAAWPLIARRVQEIPDYEALFVAGFDDIHSASDITIVHIANALAAFVNAEWQSMDSPFDAYLTENKPLPANAQRGLQLFYGNANCAQCHTGPLLTDQKFYALALPAFGPGRTRSFDLLPRDVGRMGVSNDLADAYRFRTPSLRNVALTAPYGHNGAFATLDGIIRHHADPVSSNSNWNGDMAKLPPAPWLEALDFIVQSDRAEMERQRSKLDISPIPLSDSDVSDLVAFLHSLTGQSGNTRPLGRPSRVPSGLPVD